MCNFNVNDFLAAIGQGRTTADFAKKETIYAQGAACDVVFYIQSGNVRLTVIAPNGKEAIIAILNEGDFFGEGCLAGQPLRMASATAMTDCELMRIEKEAMVFVLHREHTLSENVRLQIAPGCGVTGFVENRKSAARDERSGQAS